MIATPVLVGRAVRAFPGAAEPPMQDPSPPAAEMDDLSRLTGAELGMAVAHEVMQWRSDHQQFPDSWVNTENKLTGYYYGHPFRPYRDRNALAEVWTRLDVLGLRERYLACMGMLLRARHGDAHVLDSWTLHTCDPELACRAALLAVRTNG